MQLARLCDLLSRQPVRIKRRPHATKVHVENPWVFNVFQWNYGLNIHMLSSYVIKPKCWIHYMGRQVFFLQMLWIIILNIYMLSSSSGVFIVEYDLQNIWSIYCCLISQTFSIPSGVCIKVSQKIHQSSPKCICMHLLQFPITKSVGL